MIENEPEIEEIEDEESALVEGEVLENSNEEVHAVEKTASEEKDLASSDDAANILSPSMLIDVSNAEIEQNDDFSEESEIEDVLSVEAMEISEVEVTVDEDMRSAEMNNPMEENISDSDSVNDEILIDSILPDDTDVDAISEEAEESKTDDSADKGVSDDEAITVKSIGCEVVSEDSDTFDSTEMMINEDSQNCEDSMEKISDESSKVEESVDMEAKDELDTDREDLEDTSAGEEITVVASASEEVIPESVGLVDTVNEEPVLFDSFVDAVQETSSEEEMKEVSVPDEVFESDILNEKISDETCFSDQVCPESISKLSDVHEESVLMDVIEDHMTDEVNDGDAFGEEMTVDTIASGDLSSEIFTESESFSEEPVLVNIVLDDIAKDEEVTEEAVFDEVKDNVDFVTETTEAPKENTMDSETVSPELTTEDLPKELSADEFSACVYNEDSSVSEGKILPLMPASDEPSQETLQDTSIEVTDEIDRFDPEDELVDQDRAFKISEEVMEVEEEIYEELSEEVDENIRMKNKLISAVMNAATAEEALRILDDIEKELSINKYNKTETEHFDFEDETLSSGEGDCEEVLEELVSEEVQMTNVESVSDSDLDSEKKNVEERNADHPSKYHEKIKEEEQKSKKRIYLATFLINFAIVGAILLLFNHYFLNSQANVPLVVGLSEDEAVNLLAEEGFASSIERVFSDDIDFNLVISQDLDAHSLAVKGDKVTLLISDGKAPVAMPSLLDLSFDEAVSKLNEIGLIFKKKRVYSDTVKKNRIISQSVEEGSALRVGDTITLVVSKGKKPVYMPSLEGVGLSKATAILDQLNVPYTVVREYNSEVSKDLVSSQSLAEGEKIKKDTKIELFVSDGPVPETKASESETTKAYDPDQIDVPNVIGKTLKEGGGQIYNLGLHYTFYKKAKAGVKSGRIYYQDPEGGERVDPDSTVIIYVAY